jgi:hypothetical protein
MTLHRFKGWKRLHTDASTTVEQLQNGKPRELTNPPLARGASLIPPPPLREPLISPQPEPEASRLASNNGKPAQHARPTSRALQVASGAADVPKKKQWVITKPAARPKDDREFVFLESAAGPDSARPSNRSKFMPAPFASKFMPSKQHQFLSTGRAYPFGKASKPNRRVYGSNSDDTRYPFGKVNKPPPAAAPPRPRNEFPPSISDGYRDESRPDPLSRPAEKLREEARRRGELEEERRREERRRALARSSCDGCGESMDDCFCGNGEDWTGCSGKFGVCDCDSCTADVLWEVDEEEEEEEVEEEEEEEEEQEWE